MQSTLTSVVAFALVAAHVLPAQSPPNLIGLGRNVPRIHQHDHLACAPLPGCFAPGMPPAPPLPYAGGTAWDPTRSRVWVSSGFALAAYDMNGCAVACPPAPCPTSSPNAVCTGLAFVESLNQLWVLDSFGVLVQCAAGCPPTPVAQCTTGLAMPAVGVWPTGVAVDEGNRLVFYSTTDFATGQSWLHVATMANPCTILQTERVRPCSPTSGPFSVTGLAVDWCRRSLWLTDGNSTMPVSYSLPPGPLVFSFGNCCNWAIGPVADPLIGLDVRPGGATQLGAPCSSGACAPCPMTHTLRNDPNLGNASFALGLDNAPSGALSWCAIGLGPCMAPGTALPPLCGPIHLPMIAGTIGATPTGPGGPCGGSATYPLPLPPLPSLCGTVLSSQCIVLCTAPGAFGFAMSPCLTFRLQGS